jgi:hypothetical protein
VRGVPLPREIRTGGESDFGPLFSDATEENL